MRLESDPDVVVYYALFLKKLVQRLEFDHFGCLWDCFLRDFSHLSCHDDTSHCGGLFHLNYFNMCQNFFLRKDPISFWLKLDAL